MSTTEMRLARIAPRGQPIAASYGDGRIHRGTVASEPRVVDRRWFVMVDCEDGISRTFGVADVERVEGRH